MATKRTVKLLNVTKAFGFIAPVQGPRKSFVHTDAVESAEPVTLREGQKVSYDLERGADGEQFAINVRVLQ
jgi:cold shock protein